MVVVVVLQLAEKQHRRGGEFQDGPQHPAKPEPSKCSVDVQRIYIDYDLVLSASQQLKIRIVLITFILNA